MSTPHSPCCESFSILFLHICPVKFIDTIEKLGSCVKLQVLNLNGNRIESITNNVISCPQLWSLNLSNNKVSLLQDLSNQIFNTPLLMVVVARQRLGGGGGGLGGCGDGRGGGGDDHHHDYKHTALCNITFSCFACHFVDQIL